MKLFFAGSTSGEAEASLMLYHQLPVKKKKKQKYEVYKISLASFLVRLSVENILYERQTKFCTEICVYRIPGSDKNGRAQCVRASANVGATVNDGSRGATRHHHYSFFSPALDIADGIFFFYGIIRQIEYRAVRPRVVVVFASFGFLRMPIVRLCHSSRPTPSTLSRSVLPEPSSSESSRHHR